jgi:hypothetical protein
LEEKQFILTYWGILLTNRLSDSYGINLGGCFVFFYLEKLILIYLRKSCHLFRHINGDKF